MMRLLFWFGVGWLGYVYIGYPLILAMVGLVQSARPVMHDDFLPTISVLIAARNEARDIGWKIMETLQWNYPADRLEILIASDASEDGTDEIVQGIKDPRITFVRMERRCGKNEALNCLVQHARGGLLFFTDANVHIEPDCLRRMIRYFSDPRVGCVTGITLPVQENELAIGSGSGVYWGYESMIARLENRIGSVLVCDGAIFCMRRSSYTALMPGLANDLEIPFRVAHDGFWILHEPTAYNLDRDTPSPWEEFARRRRICAQGMLGMWRLRSTLRGMRGWQFLSHKLLRWLTLVPLLFLLVSCAFLASRLPFRVLLGIQTLFYASALIGFLLTVCGRGAGRLISIPFYVLLGSAGTLVGMVDTCLGRQFAIWEIPAMSRGGAPPRSARIG